MAAARRHHRERGRGAGRGADAAGPRRRRRRGAALTTLTVATLNLASGRDHGPTPLSAELLGRALGGLHADVVCLQEVDVGQPRSHDTHQVEVAARALGLTSWRFAPTLAGTPSPWRTWHRLPAGMADDQGPRDRPLFGNAVLSRHPVSSWHVRGLGHGRARLPLRAPGPAGGAAQWWWIPDEPRVAVAARLEDGMTVVSTHLSFSPPTAVRQLRRLRSWAAGLGGPVVVAGDLNLPGRLPARLLGGTSAVSGATYPVWDPRVQLDHVVVPPGVRCVDGHVQRLEVGDHRAVVATLSW